MRAANRALAALVLASGLLLVLCSTARCEEVVVGPDDPPVHVHSPSTCHTDGGTDLRLPPSYIVPEQAWDDLDREMRRLQDQETKLTAENQKLRDLTERDTVTTLTYVGAGVLVGLVGGLLAPYLF